MMTATLDKPRSETLKKNSKAHSVNFVTMEFFAQPGFLIKSFDMITDGDGNS